MFLDRKSDAIAQYLVAFKSMDESIEYRRMVEVKLNGLGVDPQNAASDKSGSPAANK
jgi:hypothetical protein